MRFRVLFSIFVAALTASSVAKADVYRIIDSNEEALQVRVDMIQQARSEIIMVYYAFAQDATSYQILSLLREARERRGVSIYLLIDAMNSELPKSVRAVLQAAGIQVAFYNRTNDAEGVAMISHRMHDKYLITDAKHLLMGGRNMKDAYFGFGDENFSDRDVYIEGGASYVARHYFINRWNSQRVKRAPYAVTKKHVRQADEALDQAFVSLSSHPFVKLDTGYDWGSIGHTNSVVEFIHDPVKGESSAAREISSADAFFEAIESATQTLHIESPYVVPTPRLWKALKKLRSRGVSIRILTNSAISGDTVIAQAAYQNSKKRLLKMGIELWEFEVEDVTLHSKSFVVDGFKSVIGSYNLDPRSQNINTETLSIVDDPLIAQELEKSMQGKLAFARQIQKNGKPTGSSTKFPGLSPGKKIAFRIWQYTLSVLLRSLI
ncbi:MAG: phosphatidylserine/phosphatidylglycerophosphate/cardiolipin synthase family protein [Bdellovibrionales bacterium]|nr:phosphatidylserine/phosphatidylglycerophosphate/cardiolipin synthase family protein [Bdellovibrionales bacterium]